MTDYAAPVRDMSFVIEELIGLESINTLPGLDWVTGDLVRAVLTEAGKFGGEVLAPLNRVGDIQGCELKNGVVTTPDGFADAYRQFTAGGWNGLIATPEYGGQGMPWLVATALGEIWESANLAFSLCPMLTQSGIWALSIHGSPELKDIWLAKLVSGEWAGTMNLTEPHAGSDVGALRTRAMREGDRFRIAGQKIFITWGEHDMAENIVHMVLARIDGAPEGTRGVSLFIVPKYLVNPDGSLGPRNDLRCAALEHKLGIHASPTAVMSYGDDGGAIGYLVGEENRGMEYMFTMMNNARLGVGREGLAMAERAFQQARDYAAGRVQGRSVADPAAGPVAIVNHPDVQRMLLTMKAEIEAMRALTYSVAADLDIARRHEDPGIRARRQARVDLLVPVVKAWCSDTGVAVTSEAVQVHGGAGFIEETGAAQHYRDSRITPIYEGTNGIQALDLVRRKILADRGAALDELMAEMDCLARSSANPRASAATAPILDALAGGIAELREATDWLLADRPARASDAAATPYLALLGTVAGGYLLARSAIIAESRTVADGEDPFYRSKVETARFYAECVLPKAASLKHAAIGGAELLQGFDHRRLWH